MPPDCPTACPPARLSARPASSAVMMATGVDERRARASLARWVSRQDLGRIAQHASRADDVVRRYGQRYVETAVLEVELSSADVGLVVPAAHVVVDRHARIPLSELVERAVATHAARPVVGHREAPADVEVEELARLERPRQVDPHRRARHGGAPGSEARAVRGPASGLRRSPCRRNRRSSRGRRAAADPADWLRFPVRRCSARQRARGTEADRDCG